MPSRDLFYFNATNSSSPTQLNQGPWEIGSLNKLLRVRLRGNITVGVVTDIASSSTFSNNLNLGIQFGNHGYTPHNVVTDDALTDFLWTGQQIVGPGQTMWAPSTDTPGYFAYTVLNEEWNGQFLIQADTDFYLSFGNPFGSDTGPYNVAGTVEFLFV